MQEIHADIRPEEEAPRIPMLPALDRIDTLTDALAAAALSVFVACLFGMGTMF